MNDLCVGSSTTFFCLESISSLIFSNCSLLMTTWLKVRSQKRKKKYIDVLMCKGLT